MYHKSVLFMVNMAAMKIKCMCTININDYQGPVISAIVAVDTLR